MPKVSQIPGPLRPFYWHGVNADSRNGTDEAVGDCLFCGRDGKFYVNVEKGLYSCKICGADGDTKGFLKRVYEEAEKDNAGDYLTLKNNRKLLSEATLRAWGIVWSPYTAEWLIPGHDQAGVLRQLYRYLRQPDGGYRPIPTPELGHQLHGVHLYDSRKPVVFFCEGPFDGLALWEILRQAKQTDEGLAVTANEGISLFAQANVLATPGCNVFNEEWLPLFAGKKVVMLYDSDHPRRMCKKCKKSFSTIKFQVCPTCRVTIDGPVVAPAGNEGMKRVAGIFASAEEPPSEVHYLKWGSDGFDPERPSGFDIRDILSINGDSVANRVQNLAKLLRMTEPIPESWVAGRTKHASRNGSMEIEILPCNNWNTLIKAWIGALKWTEGLDRALSVMLASIISTNTLGDPVWLKVMSPPSTGKSTLCEAIAVAKEYIISKSTIRGFHSGYKSDKTGEEDHSLIPKLRDKTFIIKDGDTLLQAPNLSQILSEARDLYDGVSRTHYRHGVDRDYENVRFTFILCGTSRLRMLDDSELGARFLDCIIMESIDNNLERNVNLKVAHRAFRNVKITSNGKAESRNDPAMLLAKQLTAGYIVHLRKNASQLIDKVTVDDSVILQCIQLGEFVSFIRARPSKHQDEVIEREFSPRLVEQISRLTACLAVVLGRYTVDEEVMRRVKRVALDTARGKTLDLTRLLVKHGRVGITAGSIAITTADTEDEIKKTLRFLKGIGVVEVFTTQIGAVRSASKWRLTERMASLWKEVMGDE